MSDNTPSRHAFYLAGLLHDIGKFWQRADKTLGDKQNEISGYSKKIAGDICPVNDYGKFGYQHVIWCNEFFEKFEIKLKEIPGFKINVFAENNLGENNVVNFAVNHHKPRNLYQAIITIADWWSAGIDRTDPKTFEKYQKEDENINWGTKRYKQIPLYSIFNSVYGGNYKLAYKLKRLSVENSKDIFPVEINTADDGLNEQSYQELWKGFINEFDRIPTDDLVCFNESLFFLMKKYTWCIPSNTLDMANISLFEHSKTTAAFADCLFASYQDKPNNFIWDGSKGRLKIKNDYFPVILIGGDLSGIQKFIYNIASRKAAKSLKGRSFYLQLLIDSIIHKIVFHEEIGAGIGHVLYSSGGKFYLILPNTKKVQVALTVIKKDIEQELWNDHHGKLIFNMDYVEFKYNSDSKEIEYNGKEEKNINGLWKTLSDKLVQQKNKKFRHLLLDKTWYNDFFTVRPVGGDVEVCAVTGMELKKDSKNTVKLDNDVIVSKQVYDQIKLGESLKDAGINLMFKGDGADSKYLDSKLEKIKVAGISNYLLKKDSFTQNTSVSSADISRIRLINDTGFLNSNIKGHNISYGYHFYGGNRQAQKPDGVNKTFEELTELIPGDKDSKSYFGVLRLDVDNLGDVFINGLKGNAKSFSAFATMSFMLDLFFSGYLNFIRNDLKERDGAGNENSQYKYREFVNIIYSGGDDVFAVGYWNKIIELAEDITSEFKRFIGRDDITLSAGIAITNNKFPIAKAAELAGEAEKKSKKFKSPEKGEKNAITFFDETVSWNDEYLYVKNKKNEFFDLIINDGMSKGILHRLMAFGQIKKNNEIAQKSDKNSKPDYSYKWHTAYYLKRFASRHENENVKSFIKNLQEELFRPSRNYDLIALAARWAELELKDAGKTS